MKKFEFQNYTERLDIAGNTFDLECTIETGEMIRDFGNQLKSITDEIASGTKTAKDAVTSCCGMIDTLLGEGAAAQIFNGRKIRIDDAVDVCLFIIQAVTENYARQNATLKNQGNRFAVKS